MRSLKDLWGIRQKGLKIEPEERQPACLPALCMLLKCKRSEPVHTIHVAKNQFRGSPRLRQFNGKGRKVRVCGTRNLFHPHHPEARLASPAPSFTIMVATYLYR